MSIRGFLSKRKWLRQTGLRILRRVAFDFRIRNPHTADFLYLNLYRHKGYWFWRKLREKDEMRTFKSLISDGSLVIEVGAHIGFITQYFSTLSGSGRVLAFEPGFENLKYLTRNTRHLSNVAVITSAVSDESGVGVLYEDQITGQNNSLNQGYHGASSTASTHPRQLASKERLVHKVRLDEILQENDIQAVCFIKIDVEGHELAVLRSLGNEIFKVKRMMVEITENHQEVLTMLTQAGFGIHDEKLAPVDWENRHPIPAGNVFAIRPSS